MPREGGFPPQLIRVVLIRDKSPFISLKCRLVLILHALGALAAAAVLLGALPRPGFLTHMRTRPHASLRNACSTTIAWILASFRCVLDGPAVPQWQRCPGQTPVCCLGKTACLPIHCCS